MRSVALGVRPPAGLSGWIRFIGKLRSMNGQIVHFQRPDGIIPGAPIARLFGKRVVVTLHMPYARRQDSLLGLSRNGSRRSASVTSSIAWSRSARQRASVAEAADRIGPTVHSSDAGCPATAHAERHPRRDPP
jgi:hypothetical protein